MPNELIDSFHHLFKGDVVMRVFTPQGLPHPDPMSVFGKDPIAQERAAKLPRIGHEIGLDHNLVVNSGRQVIANLLGGKDYNSSTPNSDWIVKYVRFGRFDTAARFTDTTLSPQPDPGNFTGGENTILYNGTDASKLISAVDWPQDFVVRFEFSLGPDEANGETIREMGLFTGNGTLVARKTVVPIVKSSDAALTMLWRIRT